MSVEETEDHKAVQLFLFFIIFVYYNFYHKIFKIAKLWIFDWWLKWSNLGSGTGTHKHDHRSGATNLSASKDSKAT